MSNDNADGRLVVKRFPHALHRRLRVAAAETGIDMRDIVIAAVETHLDVLDAMPPADTALPLERS